jgi:hypothetical protein
MSKGRGKNAGENKGKLYYGGERNFTAAKKKEKNFIVVWQRWLADQCRFILSFHI